MSGTPPRHALVFGASGLAGRNLVLALREAGAAVTTATRSDASARGLGRWLGDHGVEAPPNVLVDFADPGLLPGGPEAYGHATEVFNCSGAFRFGMGDEEARAANVGTTEAIVDFAAGLPRLTRIVHVSGYRVGGQDPADVPWTPERRRETYRRLGAYEASKMEADAVFQARSARRGLAWTVVNPSTVIGHSATGETDQYLGLAASLRDLWRGALPAIPGNQRTFVPVVTADYLARFMALVPTDPATAGRSLWVLDEGTPALADLLAGVGRHYGVRVARLRIPVEVLTKLPVSVTKAEPETLTFLSSDRYPVAEAAGFAARHGLPQPDTGGAVLAWADHLAAHRFGDAEPGRRGFRDMAGVRTFTLGDPDAATVVLPGLPVNAETWAGAAQRLGGARVVDLPGLGLSGGDALADWDPWLEALTASGGLHVVGHSIGAAAALQAAAAHPERVARLTLVSPFFLQSPAGAAARFPPLGAAYLRRVSPAALSTLLTGSDAAAGTLEPAVADLRRPGVAWAVARLLRRAASSAWRTALCELLAQYPGPVHVVVGERDPLTPEGHALLDSLPAATLSFVAGAGHHPQLTHADATAALLGGRMAASSAAVEGAQTVV